jgi:hypothetical protein
MKVKMNVVTELYSMPAVIFDSYEAALSEAKSWFETIDDTPIYEISFEIIEF